MAAEEQAAVPSHPTIQDNRTFRRRQLHLIHFDLCHRSRHHAVGIGVIYPRCAKRDAPHRVNDTNSTTGGRVTPTHMRALNDGLEALAVACCTLRKIYCTFCIPRNERHQQTGGRATLTHIRVAQDVLVALAVDPKVSLLAFVPVSAVALIASRDVRPKYRQVVTYSKLGSVAVRCR